MKLSVRINHKFNCFFIYEEKSLIYDYEGQGGITEAFKYIEENYKIKTMDLITNFNSNITEYEMEVVKK